MGHESVQPRKMQDREGGIVFLESWRVRGWDGIADVIGGNFFLIFEEMATRLVDRERE